MLSKKIEDILNAQIEKEGYSSHLYLAMASWADNHGYEGISNWFYAQAEEERMHMLKFVHYINERGGHSIVPLIKQPPVDFPDVKTIFDESLKHEQYITASINAIVGLSIEEKDFTTHNWLQWFVTEQMEEEASVQRIIDKLKMLGDKNMYMFDRDVMGMRGTVAKAE